MQNLLLEMYSTDYKFINTFVKKWLDFDWFYVGFCLLKVLGSTAIF